MSSTPFKIKFFQYDHCPYCTRVRLILGLKKIPYEIQWLQYDDSITPMKLVGKKVAPFIEYEEGKYMLESLDIVKYLDNLSAYGPPLLTPSTPTFKPILDNFSTYPRPLIYSRYWYNTPPFPEFSTQSSIDYFGKKQEKYGSFEEALKNSEIYEPLMRKLNENLQILSTHLPSTETIKQNNFQHVSYDDIQLFAMLREITIVKNSIWPENVKTYVELLAKRSENDLYFERAI